MIRPYLRMIIVVICGVLLSAWLTGYVASSTGFRGPGATLVHFLDPPGHVGQNDLVDPIFLYLGIHFVFFFSVLTGLYLFFTKLFPAREK